MKVVRVRVERCSTCQDDPARERRLPAHPCGRWAGAEGRVVFNRAETVAIAAGLRARELFYGEVVWRVLRARCRVLGQHSVACHGRRDHLPVRAG